ncbi:carbohydrate esterase family 5 protein [Plenodomus tracheiphilus IPT5]|uniref:Carbohydrate esterase family 5 protein n=1 Tax=Plenodomus tracheiphilus IPT5 TaxID=1408161 RepID=A0A6A7BHI2_9PLEO|nr:carbohydrate esterase family 5 protein [Plenodomus tracheiphilus IPT5]
MVSLQIVLLAILCALASAKRGCRCGDVSFLAIPRVNITTPQQVKPCIPYKLLDARGSGKPQSVSLMFQTAIERLLANNTDAAYQSIVYPAGFAQNTTSGVQNTVDLINYGLKDCPGQKYFLFGYSQGATVVLEAIKELGDEAVASVESVVLVGNPYRIPGRRGNVDDYGRRDNRTVYGLFAEQERGGHESASALMYSDEFDRSGKVVDVCLEDDVVCAADAGCDCQLASDHLSYGLLLTVQDLIFDHVVSRF